VSDSSAALPVRAREQLDPGTDEPFVGGIFDGGKDAIGRLRAILLGGLEGKGAATGSTTSSAVE
jgi:hypothetical protein